MGQLQHTRLGTAQTYTDVKVPIQQIQLAEENLGLFCEVPLISRREITCYPQVNHGGK